MRTKGAIAKAKYVGVSLGKLREMFGDQATIFVSLEHHGAVLGVDRNTAPRTKSLIWGEITVPAVPVATHISIPNVAPAEEPTKPVDADAHKVNLEEFD